MEQPFKESYVIFYEISQYSFSYEDPLVYLSAHCTIMSTSNFQHFSPCNLEDTWDPHVVRQEFEMADYCNFFVALLAVIIEFACSLLTTGKRSLLLRAHRAPRTDETKEYSHTAKYVYPNRLILACQTYQCTNLEHRKLSNIDEDLYYGNINMSIFDIFVIIQLKIG